MVRLQWAKHPSELPVWQRNMTDTVEQVFRLLKTAEKNG